MTARPEDLLAHAAWLRSLARSLVHDPALADDLTQQTWIAALESPPDPTRGPAQAWLATVLRNFARMARRGEARRTRRDAERGEGALGEGTPGPDEVIARVEMERRLAAEVLALDEPYRSTVLLRYHEGLSGAEIAERMGVAAGTVRWRLKTGLDRLRDTLSERPGGEPARFEAALLALAGPPPSALAPAHPGTVARAPIPRGFVVLGGAAVVLGIVLWMGLVRWSGAEAGAPAARPSANASMRAPERTGAAGMPRTPPPTRRAPAAPAAPLTLPSARVVDDATAESGTVEGLVRDWASGQPVGGAELTFAAGGQSLGARSGADGRFRLVPERPGCFQLVEAIADGYLPFAPDWGHSPVEVVARPGKRVTDLTVWLVPAIDYHGRVVRPDGGPAPGASIRILTAASGEQALHPIRESYVADARGEFVFHAPDGALLEARLDDFGPGRAVLDAAAAVSHRLVLRLGERGTGADLGTATIEGQVVDDEGLPVEGARLRARPAGDRGDPAEPTLEVEAASDEDGRFVLAGLDPGDWLVEARAQGLAGAERERVPAGARGLRFVLGAGGRLVGRVVDAGSGAPVAAFTLAVLEPRSALDHPVLAIRSIVDPEGRFDVTGLPPGPVLVVARGQGWAPSPEIAGVARPRDVAESPGTALEIRLGRGGSLGGRVVETDTGRALEHARVSLEQHFGTGPSSLPLSASVVTNAAGEFLLTGIAPGLTSVHVAAGNHHRRMVSGLEIREGERAGPIVVDLRPTAPGETPELELAGIGAVLRTEGDGLRIERVLDGGGAAAAGLAAGDVIVAVDGVAVTQLGFDGTLQRIRGPEGTRVTLALRRADGSLLEITVPRRRIRA